VGIDPPGQIILPAAARLNGKNNVNNAITTFWAKKSPGLYSTVMSYFSS
jgi:hypothetical protein